MPEIVVGSTTEKFEPSADYEKAEETIAHLNAAVMDFLTSNNIDPSSVIFSGFSETSPKLEGSEHWEAGEKPAYYFGNVRSLASPQSFSDDEELQGEHWAVNPLKYAISNGSLGIYNKSKLDKLSGGPLDSDPKEVEEFGTSAYYVDPALLGQAKIAQLNLRSK